LWHHTTPSLGVTLWDVGLPGRSWLCSLTKLGMTFWFSEDSTVWSFPVGSLSLVPDQDVASAFVVQMVQPIVIFEQQNRCVCTHYGMRTIVFLRILSSSAVMRGSYYVVLKHLCTQSFVVCGAQLRFWFLCCPASVCDASVASVLWRFTMVVRLWSQCRGASLLHASFVFFTVSARLVNVLFALNACTCDVGGSYSFFQLSSSSAMQHVRGFRVRAMRAVSCGCSCVRMLQSWGSTIELGLHSCHLGPVLEGTH